MKNINQNKLELVVTLLRDYRRVNDCLNSYIGDKEKSLNNASEVLYSTMESLLKEMGLIGETKLKKQMKWEFEHSPMTLLIKDDKGIYRSYEKISYYVRNIIYASYGFGIDTKCFTYKGLQIAIKNKEVEVK